MIYEYEVYTTIPRNFEPDVEGLTIDSIVGSCHGYLDHSVPEAMIDNKTHIKIKTSKPLDFKYLVDQLNDNFREGEISVVEKIVRNQPKNL